MISSRHVFRVHALLGTLLLAGGCASDDVVGPPPPSGTFTVDASHNWVYVSLSDGEAIAMPLPPNLSDAWDVAFNATSVMLNGGVAGPGGVTGFCVCQNASASNAEVLAMTPASELPDFEAVTGTPAGASFTAEKLTPAIAGWYTGTGAAAVADPSKTFLLRLADNVTFAKVRVAALEAPSATAAGRVTLEFAVQPSPDARFGTTKTLVVDLTTAGAKSVDLKTAALATNDTDWDLRLEGFTIRVNGGVSGPGNAGATPGSGSFESIATASVVANAYKTDTYAGVFAAQPWYKYNIAGDNRISPTFNVYLLKRGSAVYRLQITGYYSATDEPRHISLRYAQIED
jgi:hypothetical protein